MSVATQSPERKLSAELGHIYENLTEAIGIVLASEVERLRNEAETDRAIRDAEHRATIAELNAAISSVEVLKQQVQDRLSAVKDGAPGRDGNDGASVTAEDVLPQLREHITAVALEAVAAIPVPKDGAPGRDGKDGRDGERGEPGPMGALGVCKDWEDRVYQQGETATFDGSIFQAQRDTGKAPPHEDWLCIVRAGRDGADGRSFDHVGLYDPEKNYSAMQVVALNGGAFVARHDDPGPCPGDGWALLASQGKTGKPGPKGDPGPRGPVGPAVARLVVDDTGMLTLVNADGLKIECDLYPLLKRIDK
jgi:hypothetical protein